MNETFYVFQLGRDIGASFVSFETLLAESDFIFIACPLTNTTRYLFDNVAFGRMKRTSVLINIARGGAIKTNNEVTKISSNFLVFLLKGVIVQADLIEALQKGTIFAAGLDVMDPEPLPRDHPLTKLTNCGNEHLHFTAKPMESNNNSDLVLTPHLGSAAKHTRDNMSLISAQNLINGIEGSPMINLNTA